MVLTIVAYLIGAATRWQSAGVAAPILQGVETEHYRTPPEKIGEVEHELPDEPPLGLSVDGRQ
jgi:hypothetical protein